MGVNRGFLTFYPKSGPLVYVLVLVNRFAMPDAVRFRFGAAGGFYFKPKTFFESMGGFVALPHPIMWRAYLATLFNGRGVRGYGVEPIKSKSNHGGMT